MVFLTVIIFYFLFIESKYRDRVDKLFEEDIEDFNQRIEILEIRAGIGKETED